MPSSARNGAAVVGAQPAPPHPVSADRAAVARNDLNARQRREDEEMTKRNRGRREKEKKREKEKERK